MPEAHRQRVRRPGALCPGAVTIEGRSSQWSRRGDSGGSATFEFCPTCAALVCWTLGEGFIAVAVDAFADPTFPPPVLSVYEGRMHPWAFAAGELPMEHWD
jgi:hypothetical protein